MAGLAVETKKKGDEQRLFDILGKLAMEDPSFTVERHPTSNETVIRGLGDMHLKAKLMKMQQQYKLELRHPAAAHPLPRDDHRQGMKLPTDTRNRAEAPASSAKWRCGSKTAGARRRLRVRRCRRAVAPYPAASCRRWKGRPAGARRRHRWFSGRGHSRHRVRRQDARGRRQGKSPSSPPAVAPPWRRFCGAQPILLEPVVEIEILAPENAIGDLTGDLAGKRGHITGTGERRPQRHHWQVPLAELADYQSRLKSLTGGQGSYSLAFSHYARRCRRMCSSN